MEETLMQQYFAEQKNNRRSDFEKRRPPVFNLEKPLAPDKIKTVLQDYVKTVIEKCKKPEKGSSFLADDTIVLRMPEDAHLIPLIETTVFRELLKFSKNNSPHKYADLRALMFMDPELNSLETEGIRGESLLMHELRHHQSDSSSSTIPVMNAAGGLTENTDDYIALKFFQENKKIHYLAYYIPDPTVFGNKINNIQSDLGPLNPANNDLIRATRAYTSLPVTVGEKMQTWFETIKIIAGKSKILTSQWHMGNKLMPVWKQKHPEINPANYS